MKQDELKPCPFCGGKAEIRIADINSSGNELYLLKCCNIKCSVIPKVPFHSYDKDKLIDAWNRRAEVP